MLRCLALSRRKGRSKGRLAHMFDYTRSLVPACFCWYAFRNQSRPTHGSLDHLVYGLQAAFSCGSAPSRGAERRLRFDRPCSSIVDECRGPRGDADNDVVPTTQSHNFTSLLSGPWHPVSEIRVACSPAVTGEPRSMPWPLREQATYISFGPWRYR